MNTQSSRSSAPQAERDFKFRHHLVPAGTRTRIDIEVAKLPGQAQMCLPLEVVVGSCDKTKQQPAPCSGSCSSPCVWLSAAIHGDEINGMEIITQALRRIEPHRLNGVLLAVPIVNVFGFAFHDRYMPDRRDLNRSFPGSKKGSLASRLAHLFSTEIVDRCSHGIDLHTGSHHRTNLPQIRADLDNPEARRMANAFHAPVMIHGNAPDGSLRQAAGKKGKPIIVYEAGEAQRFDQSAIALGVSGVLRVLEELGMLETPTEPADETLPQTSSTIEVRKRTWVRAPISGILGLQVELGDRVKRGDTLGDIHEPLGDERRLLTSPKDGVVIGHSNNPLAYQGDALVHLART